MVRRIHNPQLYRILAFSPDISRLGSQANVLTQAGYSVDLVLKIDQAARRIQVGQYQLAVVSCSLSRDEQLAIRTRLKQLRQKFPVLLLGSEHDSPDVLLAAVADILKQKKALQFGPKLDGVDLDPPMR